MVTIGVKDSCLELGLLEEGIELLGAHELGEIEDGLELLGILEGLELVGIAVGDAVLYATIVYIPLLPSAAATRYRPVLSLVM